MCQRTVPTLEPAKERFASTGGQLAINREGRLTQRRITLGHIGVLLEFSFSRATTFSSQGGKIRVPQCKAFAENAARIAQIGQATTALALVHYKHAEALDELAFSCACIPYYNRW